MEIKNQEKEGRKERSSRAEQRASAQRGARPDKRMPKRPPPPPRPPKRVVSLEEFDAETGGAKIVMVLFVAAWGPGSAEIGPVFFKHAPGQCLRRQNTCLIHPRSHARQVAHQRSKIHLHTLERTTRAVRTLTFQNTLRATPNVCVSSTTLWIDPRAQAASGEYPGLAFLTVDIDASHRVRRRAAIETSVRF